MFDLDPTVHARRVRALPEGDDLPAAQRRGAAWCAAGYPGRKRAETQFSTLMVSHAGTGLWAFTDVVPGNTPFAAATARAAKAVVSLAAWTVLDTARLLLRFDGAGGHHEAIAGAVNAGVHYLTRLGSCHVLEQPGVAEHLATAVWRDVPDSGSGPRRQATELGDWALSKEAFARETADQQALRARLVVSRFPAAADGKKRGAGVVIGPWQYEVFATDIAADAWPAADSVTLYYGRCGQENAFAASYDELRLGDVFSESPHGQRLMTAIAMWVANLRRVAAAALPGGLGPAPEQQPRPAEAAQASATDGQASLVSSSPDGADGQSTPVAAHGDESVAVSAAPLAPDSPVPHATGVPSTADDSAEPIFASAAATAAEPQSEPMALDAAVLERVPATVTCPAGLPMPFVGLQLAKGIYVYARYGEYRAPCGGCTDRSACTGRTDTAYRRTMTIAVPAGLLPLRRAIAAHYRAAGRPPAQPTPPSPPAQQRLRAAALASPAPQITRARLTLAQPTEPGPLLPQAPCLYMSALLNQWQRWVAIHRVEVTLRPAAPPPIRPWVRETTARRQCRRKTHAERLLYNAPRQSSQVEVIRYVG